MGRTGVEVASPSLQLAMTVVSGIERMASRNTCLILLIWLAQPSWLRGIEQYRAGRPRFCDRSGDVPHVVLEIDEHRVWCVLPDRQHRGESSVYVVIGLIIWW